MQLPAPFVALLATVTLALFSVDARPVRSSRATGRMITLPLRRMQGNTNLHVELRHQQQINRAHRLMARASGLPGPSDAQLRANLEKRASFIPSSPTRRFNRPSSDYVLASDDDGAVISNLAVDNSNDSNQPAVLAQNSTQIDIDGADTGYLATVEIGTPSRNFAIILDSGSSDFWVGSDVCTDENGNGCGNHTFLSAANSQSFVNTGKKWSVTYGSGAASGEIVTDTVILGGMVLGNHSFGVAHSMSQSFSGDKAADGLMGLGGKGLSNQGVPTPVQAMKDTGFIDQAITSYRLPRLLDHTNNGEVTFGGLDESKFDRSTLVTVNSTGDGFWFAPLGGVSVDGDDVSGIQSTVGLMDTGTTLLVVPTKESAAIHAKIPGAKLQSSGQWSIPCGTNTTVALKFGGKSFPINPKDLVFASFGKTTGDCTSGIGSFDDTKFLVGDTFLKSVYFSTNVDENTITLAQAI
ncbi:Acid protease [Mycena venus]|uniref:Acid protease n=1 Tax=Mycena venus TaxID=2733690 RepID=A0A8H7CAU3_9AGAR|nr:Acid protease [Mycena venus]